MYHQFKELADVDITKEPMEVGPTTHYVMGGVRVDADTQMSTVPGLFAAGECAAGINGANRLGGNSLSDLLVFGKRAGEYAAKYAKEHGAPARSTTTQIEAAAKRALEPFERERRGDEPVSGSARPAGDDAGPGRHRPRRGGDDARAGRHRRAAEERADAGRASTGNREYNPGWHTALDLHNLLTVSEAIARAALERKESRGGHFRDDYPRRRARSGAR